MKMSYCITALLLILVPLNSVFPQKAETKLTGATSEEGFSIKNQNNTLLKVTNEGNVGIGTTNPTKKLEVNGSIGWGTSKASLESDHGASIELRGNGNPYIDFSGSPSTDYNVRLILQPNNVLGINGNVGIGTNNTNGYKLAIAGNAIAEEIVVKLKENWPDYVFHRDYKKISVDELENYIHNNGHLPNIPDAKEINRNGINVGEVQMRLLEKIEELTLYLIDQNKKIVKLEDDVEQLKKKIEGN
jgi:hypothetical protein